MSVSMAILGENYSIVAADTRTTNFLNGNVDDDGEKIFRYKWGWVSESGGVSAATDLFKLLLTAYIYDTRKQIHNFWLKSIKGTIEAAEKCGVKGTDQEMNSSNAFVSINYFSDRPVLEIDTMDFKYGRRVLNAKNSLIINPPKQTKRIKRLIKKYSSLATGDVHEAIYVMACFLHGLAKTNKWVSSTLDCGISLQISDTEILLMRLRQNAELIKSVYEERGDLSEMMMVCEKAPNQDM